MTRSPGGPGRQPGKPYKDRDAERRRSILSRGGSGSSSSSGSGGSGVRPGGATGSSAFDDDDLEDEFTSTSDRNDSLSARKASPRPGVRPPTSKTGGQRQVARATPKEEPKMVVKLVYIEPVKRGVAFMIDIIVAFILSMIIAAIVSLLAKLIPPLGAVVTQQGLVIAFLLIKDFLYQGRGIGKNLMGLQVVDVYTGLPPSILQSAKRNVVFYAPLILTLFLQLVLKFLPLGNLNLFVQEASNLICVIYVLAVVPAECWLAYNREDSRRLGDRFAGTGVVEGQMNFTRPF